VGIPLGLPAVALHQDFQRFVTLESPAVPGEIVHLFMTGLGAVAPAVATGAPAPAIPPAKLASSITFVLANYASHPTRTATYPVEVLFAGLAPNLVGVYQVSLRLPDSTPGSVSADFYLTMEIGGAGAGPEPFPFAAK